MTRYYDIDEANAALPDVERILLALRDQRAELIRLRDMVLAGEQARTDDGGRTEEGGRADGPPGTATLDVRTLRLRMQGLIDQMQAGVGQLVEIDVTLREIENGLIDFPALASGRQIWLCWRLGEGEIAWWHEHADGFAGRRRLADLT
jgi:hypothetical protein